MANRSGLSRSQSFGGSASSKPGLLRRAQNLLTVPLPTMDEVQEEVFDSLAVRPHAERRKSESSFGFGQSFRKYVDNVSARLPRTPSLRRASQSHSHPRAVSDSEASLHRSLSTSDRPRSSSKRHSHSHPHTPAHSLDATHKDNMVTDPQFEVPTALRRGTQMIKVSSKQVKTNVFSIDPDQGQILWPSRKAGMIPIEAIREIRTGPDARNYREQFRIAPDAEARWLSIVYSVDNKYKTLHLVAPTRDVFTMWEVSLRALHSIRQQLMKGLDHSDLRQKLWERQHWRGADAQGDAKLDFGEVQVLCKRLNIFSAPADLQHKFEEADVDKRGTLDFAGFQRFVRLLKRRPEIERLFHKLSNEDERFDYGDFVKFMRDYQKSDLSDNELQRIFKKFADSNAAGQVISSPPQSPSARHVELALPILGTNTNQEAALTQSPASDQAPAYDQLPTEGLQLVPVPVPERGHTLTEAASKIVSSLDEGQSKREDGGGGGGVLSESPEVSRRGTVESTLSTSTIASGESPESSRRGTVESAFSVGSEEAPTPAPAAPSTPRQDQTPPRSIPLPPPTPPRPSSSSKTTPSTPGSTPTMWSVAAFTSFLISSENAAFCDQHGRVYEDMCRPLSEYYIAASHNTYLVGNQLVGSSTFEGYIRALLCGARSVELDIYDGDAGEPVVYHGRTFTGRVSVRDVCLAIHKYGFVISPYPIIISAEVHCSLPQQDALARIMREVFGDSLVTGRLAGREGGELPSPEDLKRRVLLKTKNLFLLKKDELEKEMMDGGSGGGGEDVEEASLSSASEITSASASESEAMKELKQLKQLGKKTAAKLGLSRSGNKHKQSASVSNIHPHTEAIHNAKPGATTSATSGSASESGTGTNGSVAQPHRNKQPPQSRSPSHAHTLPLQPPPSQGVQATPMSPTLASLLVYTVGVKCRGLNKKETYATEHLFSLSERTANKYLKSSMMDLVKHNRDHVVRIYPNGTRMTSSNYEPHRFWAAGCQLVALNWQTFDLGYKMNHAMFQRNGRSGYVLKPLALRVVDKPSLQRKSNHILDITVISAQQLPRPKDSAGREIYDKQIVDPFVEVSLHMPDWTHSPFSEIDTSTTTTASSPSQTSPTTEGTVRSRTASARTNVVKNNGFNPIWHETLSLAYDVVGDMKELVFVRFEVRDETGSESRALAEYGISLGSLNQGYRHIPLHDGQLQQFLFSTLFVQIGIRDV